SEILNIGMGKVESGAKTIFLTGRQINIGYQRVAGRIPRIDNILDRWIVKYTKVAQIARRQRGSEIGEQASAGNENRIGQCSGPVFQLGRTVQIKIVVRNAVPDV